MAKTNDNEARRCIAEQYVRDQLAVMDGSVEAGLARIGRERFNQTIEAVMKALPPGPKSSESD